ncbi:hypothetical protein MCW82_30140 [Azospirillum doebereinerae]|uniref:hypothetical protein n=1 Tax=Azospirillum doebereinerae TaxID=92933 RepID=UPI001EE5A25C|nr:hypothetical protein [Azospirillum doebereinerae]MCG5244039.1 hypothetical protein [Azospirillum doebereinerae]
MTDEEFRDHLDRYGGDLALWPPPAARDGRRLLLRSVRAQAMLDEATAIELALSRPGDRPPVGLADRIFEAAFRSEPSDRGFDLDEEMERPGRLM